MDIPKIIAEDLFKLKDLKRLVVFLLCALFFYFVVSIYNRFMTNQNIEQVQIQGLINLANINSLKFKSLKNEINRLDSRITNFNEKTKTPYEQILEEEKEKRGCLSITYPPQGKNKYNTPDDYFSMEKVLWNNVFNETNSTIDMNNWIADSTDKWKEEINKNINLLKSVITAEQYNLLQKSQKQWDEYKTAELDFINDLFFSSSPGGNMWGSLFYLYELKLIEDRAEILHSLYDDACFLQQIRKEWKEYMQEEAENENPVN